MPRAFLSVPDMHCDACVASVKKTILAVDPRAHVVVDLAARRLEIDSHVAEAQFKAALKDADWDCARVEQR